MATIFEQLHRSATHKVGIDPVCPQCIEKYVDGDSPAVKARQRIEVAIVIAFVEAALGAGYVILGSDTGGGEIDAKPASQSLPSILEVMFSSDDDRLYLRHSAQPKQRSWVWFVYGNDGWDVISDYTIDLEPLIEVGPVNDLVERFGS